MKTKISTPREPFQFLNIFNHTRLVQYRMLKIYAHFMLNYFLIFKVLK